MSDSYMYIKEMRIEIEISLLTSTATKFKLTPLKEIEAGLASTIPRRPFNENREYFTSLFEYAVDVQAENIMFLLPYNLQFWLGKPLLVLLGKSFMAATAHRSHSIHLHFIETRAKVPNITKTQIVPNLVMEYIQISNIRDLAAYIKLYDKHKRRVSDVGNVPKKKIKLEDVKTEDAQVKSEDRISRMQPSYLVCDPFIEKPKKYPEGSIGYLTQEPARQDFYGRLYGLN
ncbi:hypothetical protein HK103_004026 [Boothiomyces macroporosus]|uniref:Uncharacterized protein n=1 Tax=Boothiomyces macroporosus TaxID=261099 RepID=A0AAD5UHD7_9FUNG|nr:hypothetical protein HK103_004026 [Boothiomyces macroporosus]